MDHLAHALLPSRGAARLKLLMLQWAKDHLARALLPSRGAARLQLLKSSFTTRLLTYVDACHDCSVQL
jgi:hypothetical protein